MRARLVLVTLALSLSFGLTAEAKQATQSQKPTVFRTTDLTYQGGLVSRWRMRNVMKRDRYRAHVAERSEKTLWRANRMATGQIERMRTFANDVGLEVLSPADRDAFSAKLHDVIQKKVFIGNQLARLQAPWMQR